MECNILIFNDYLLVIQVLIQSIIMKKLYDFPIKINIYQDTFLKTHTFNPYHTTRQVF